MSTNYPAGFDTFPVPSSNTKTNTASPTHSELHVNLGHAIEAIQATLGVNPQGNSATLVERLVDIETNTEAAINDISGGTFSLLNGAFYNISTGRLFG